MRRGPLSWAVSQFREYVCFREYQQKVGTTAMGAKRTPVALSQRGAWPSSASHRWIRCPLDCERSTRYISEVRSS